MHGESRWDLSHEKGLTQTQAKSALAWPGRDVLDDQRIAGVDNGNGHACTRTRRLKR